MKSYRIHCMPPDQAAGPMRVVACADDHEALVRCHAMLAQHHSVEAWDGDRLVCRMIRAGTADRSSR